MSPFDDLVGTALVWLAGPAFALLALAWLLAWAVHPAPHPDDEDARVLDAPDGCCQQCPRAATVTWGDFGLCPEHEAERLDRLMRDMRRGGRA